MSKKNRKSNIIPSINEVVNDIPSINEVVEVVESLKVSGMVEMRNDIESTSVTEVDNNVTIVTKEEEKVEVIEPQLVTKVMSKVGRIDNLILTAHSQGKKMSAKDIYGVIKKEYPLADEVATLRTINCRPWHLRQAGKLPASTKTTKVAVTV
jgi:hypothetical protein